MREVEPPFDLDFKGELIRVAEHELQGKRVFHVGFKDSRKSLVVAVGLGFRDVRFWTSIPQGRQQEAEIIGKLIAGYIRGKRM